MRSGAECLEAFNAEGADLVLACLPLGDMGGQLLMERLRGLDARVPVIVSGADDDIANAADAFKHDAFEYIEEPTRTVQDLLSAVGVALGSRRGDVQLRYLQQKEAVRSSWSVLVGNCPAILEVVQVVRQVCERSSRGAAPTMLVRGETGTGKGLLAKCIHYNGVRRNQAFVEVNCAAIPANLLESELFGYERGAFTDARSSKAGLFETAQGGTLFLDEIATLPMDLQAKLLTAIEEKRIRRIGGRQAMQVDVQIIAATHSDLSGPARAGTFREDLYYRLNVVSVHLPPLRKRGSDKLLLAETFIAEMCKEYGLAPRRLSEAAAEYILSYEWPGNVRELKNQIERVLLLSNDAIIEDHHFDRPSVPPPSARQPASRGAFQFQLPDDGIGLEDIEREVIARVLQQNGGNVSRAARFLKISRQTMIYRIKKHGLDALANRLG
jgi:DNA-binding NtrC family response regulator